MTPHGVAQADRSNEDSIDTAKPPMPEKGEQATAIATDATLVGVGGTAFLAMVILKDADPWASVGVATGLVSGLKAAISLPSTLGAAGEKLRRFIKA
ncbi:hypothetical protein [Streptomyces triticiradicis]|uniref:Uncharacterized protein n=1 Tax=Streptomyces triticiradicis TaxID=2651189 RepID=A0A7J5D9L9_9ACTN|nr:hypothetical protein [Streptomyces triticiradicis]KAB1983468.1 hypothetical protein F8144_29435 [Streptomyces triticiradicis]